MSLDGENAAICYTCEEVFEIDELEPYHNFWSRAEVGKVMPVGDCPTTDKKGLDRVAGVYGGKTVDSVRRSI